MSNFLIKNTKRLFFVITLLAIITSCKTEERISKIISIESGAIPTYFDADSTTTLLILWADSKTIEREAQKEYHGNYEMINRRDLESNSKYENISKYRYLLEFDMRLEIEYNPSASFSDFSRGRTYNRINYVTPYIRDRKYNKIYKCPKEFIRLRHLKLAIRSYFKELEKQR